ncbi:MAG: sporulation integral membrane protein YlbJ [Sporolactobacillus sp.]
MKYSKSMTYLLASGSVALALLMVRYPETAVKASYAGLSIWWKSVFPALFPFFVISEMMIGFGVVRFAGVLLEPIMKPLFKVPGIGGFVLMMGMVSGFPAGARITSRLYQEKKLSRTAAERLSSFTNFSNPLFLFSVTAVDFFGQPSLGILFAIAHYAGNICVGLLMRFYKKEAGQSHKGHTPSVFAKALSDMHQERIENYQPFGKMLGDAVISSVTTLLAVGGFIALFSMIYQLLFQVGIIAQLGIILSHLFTVIGLSPNLGPASVPGIFELTIGANTIGATSAPLLEKVVLVSALLGFCGFSIQAQAISILSQAGLSVKPFLIGRLFQALFSGGIAFFLYGWLHMSDKIEARAALASPFIRSIDSYSHTILESGPWITVAGLLLFIYLLLRRTFHLQKA